MDEDGVGFKLSRLMEHEALESLKKKTPDFQSGEAYKVMSVCDVCQKGIRKIAYSRHKKGASGASKWPMRAQISKRLQKPNLHVYKGMKLCTKCLRMIKKSVQPEKEETIKTSVISSG